MTVIVFCIRYYAMYKSVFLIIIDLDFLACRTLVPSVIMIFTFVQNLFILYR
jgi:hypothetical protein